LRGLPHEENLTGVEVAERIKNALTKRGR
jgi:hypothetical protein